MRLAHRELWMELRNKGKIQESKKYTRRWWILALYDFVPLIITFIVMLVINPSTTIRLPGELILLQIVIGTVCIYTSRILFGVYNQIWRFGGSYAYIRLMEADVVAGIAYHLIAKLLPFQDVSFVRRVCLLCINLLCCIAMRLFYRFMYQYSSRNSVVGRTMRTVARVFFGLDIEPAALDEESDMNRRIKVAIVGAGRVGSMLAEELITNTQAPYVPVCFIDIDREKIGRQIFGVKVISSEAATMETLANFGVQEIVFALPSATVERKKKLYEYYKGTGCKIKVYDYPLSQTPENGKRQMREFSIDDLLFREEKEFINEETAAFYRGKTVLISGGGGSIGSELCRQIAKMEPKKLVILDVYENGAYEIQQELKFAYGAALNLEVEIATVCDKTQLEKVFDRHHPDVVLHAAAHKHVPLMEHNCCEAVKNNVFGTLNIVETSEKFNVRKFIMISTDKAVNPTNVMGATKRMCEMIVQSRTGSNTSFSATRFGNVLGSNGSVIPLFKRQIENGGPVTITDKRIIRYFMTIPEAAQLVLQSGAMAKNGELYVLDMGKPVRILELAENMIRLTGFEPYKDIDIIETGLRPGEKLYEELLIKSEALDATENKMIFIEKDKPLGREAIKEKLDVLSSALEAENDENIRQALHSVVPTFHTPEFVNAKAQQAEEMKVVNVG